MTPNLSRRLGDALGTKYVTPAEQRTIRGGIRGVESWDDLSPDVRQLVEEIEARPDPWRGIADTSRSTIPDADDDEPTLEDILAMAEEDDELNRADTTPGKDRLHHYWTVDPEGREQWVHSPKPWTTLVALLTPHVGPMKAKIFASRWFIEVKGYAAGSDLNRVAHGKPPRGNKVGPG